MIKSVLLLNDVIVRQACPDDLATMVNLSKIKRLNYEKAQPQFWRHAVDAEDIQVKWFEKLLSSDDHLLLVAVFENKIIGFIIGRIMEAPEVYDPKGSTLMIDDFCVENSNLWDSVGSKLLKEIQKMARAKGAGQTLIVSGAHDLEKRQFLLEQNLTIASEWFVGAI